MLLEGHAHLVPFGRWHEVPAFLVLPLPLLSSHLSTLAGSPLVSQKLKGKRKKNLHKKGNVIAAEEGLFDG